MLCVCTLHAGDVVSISGTFEDAPQEQNIYLKVDLMLHNASLRGKTNACDLCC